MAIQPDGSIVFAGDYFNESDYEFAVTRYLSNGSLDSSFGSGGITTTAFGSGDDDINMIAMQRDGKLVVVGEYYNGSNYEFALARYVAYPVVTSESAGWLAAMGILVVTIGFHVLCSPC